jgi:hypothetical protein
MDLYSLDHIIHYSRSIASPLSGFGDRRSILLERHATLGASHALVPLRSTEVLSNLEASGLPFLPSLVVSMIMARTRTRPPHKP